MLKALVTTIGLFGMTTGATAQPITLTTDTLGWAGAGDAYIAAGENQVDVWSLDGNGAIAGIRIGFIEADSTVGAYLEDLQDVGIERAQIGFDEHVVNVGASSPSQVDPNFGNGIGYQIGTNKWIDGAIAADLSQGQVDQLLSDRDKYLSYWTGDVSPSGTTGGLSPYIVKAELTQQQVDQILSDRDKYLKIIQD